MIKAVIFDLDDTLYSEKDYVKSGFKVVAKILSNVDCAYEKLWSAFEKGKQAIDYLLNCENIYTEDLKEQCVNCYRNHKPDIRLYEGVEDLLLSLRRNGIKTGIITDGRPEGQRAKINALKLDNMVDEIIVTDELGGVQFRKPNAAAFELMQNRLNVPYDAMIYVGDNPEKDFYISKILAVKTVRILRDYSIHGSKQYYKGIYEDYRISSLSELDSIIRAYESVGGIENGKLLFR